MKNHRHVTGNIIIIVYYWKTTRYFDYIRSVSHVSRTILLLSLTITIIITNNNNKMLWLAKIIRVWNFNRISTFNIPQLYIILYIRFAGNNMQFNNIMIMSSSRRSRRRRITIYDYYYINYSNIWRITSYISFQQ